MQQDKGAHACVRTSDRAPPDYATTQVSSALLDTNMKSLTFPTFGRTPHTPQGRRTETRNTKGRACGTLIPRRIWSAQTVFLGHRIKYCFFPEYITGLNLSKQYLPRFASKKLQDRVVIGFPLLGHVRT